MFVFFAIYLHWDGIGGQNPSLVLIRTCLFYIANIMGADDLATPGARASATMILIYFSQNIPVSEP